MARYAAPFTRTANAAQPTVGTVYSSSGTAARRGKLFELTVGCAGAPADNIYQWTVARITTAGTIGSAVVPAPLDQADSAFLGLAAQAHTVEPTYTAASTLLVVDLNQRATFRWVAAPYAELVYPATNLNGFGIRTIVATALAVDAVALVEEQ
jgi:hypothetical protein